VQDGQLARGDLLMLFSDGVPEMASGEFAVRNAFKPAAQLAREIVEQLGKPHDDASCIVLRWNQP
jgi:serine phosphatase RsbU (regulator of sigma subunit)